MGIRKQDLRDFFSSKVEARKQELRKEARAAIEVAIKPIIYATFPEAVTVGRQAEQLHDTLLAFMETHPRFKTWKLQSVVSEVNSNVIGFRDDLVNRHGGVLVGNLLSNHTDAVMKELQPLELELKAVLASKITEYQSLSKLSREIQTVIDTCRNGDTAYKRLEELGVDVSGFQASSSNLPAVIKLSVDPCVINGNCN